MGKLIAVLLIVGGGFAAYWFGFHESSAFTAYKQFISLKKRGDCTRLKPLVEGQALDWLEQYCGAGKYASAMSAAKMAADLFATPAGHADNFKRTVVSEDENADGSVTLVVDQHWFKPETNLSSAESQTIRQTMKFKPAGDNLIMTEWAEAEVKE